MIEAGSRPASIMCAMRRVVRTHIRRRGSVDNPPPQPRKEQRGGPPPPWSAGVPPAVRPSHRRAPGTGLREAPPSLPIADRARRHGRRWGDRHDCGRPPGLPIADRRQARRDAAARSGRRAGGTPALPGGCRRVAAARGHKRVEGFSPDSSPRRHGGTEGRRRRRQHSDLCAAVPGCRDAGAGPGGRARDHDHRTTLLPPW
jgi:hypothetical protein